VIGKTQLDGDGTDSEPFEIRTCSNLQAMNLDLGAIYSVKSDVDCAGFDFGDGNGFFPVGDIHHGFSGELRGNNHTVHGLRIFRRGMSAVGLFGSTAGGASIHDLRVDDAVVIGDYDVGVIVGLGEKGSTVSRCRAQGLMSTVMLTSDGSGVVGNPIGTKESDNIDQTVTAQASPL
jgi:hypothetical protein